MYSKAALMLWLPALVVAGALTLFSEPTFAERSGGTPGYDSGTVVFTGGVLERAGRAARKAARGPAAQSYPSPGLYWFPDSREYRRNRNLQPWPDYDRRSRYRTYTYPRYENGEWPYRDSWSRRYRWRPHGRWGYYDYVGPRHRR